MHGRWFNVAVVVLWLVTMTWLVREKVLPGLLVGEPPNYQKILEARRTEPPVGWQLQWNHRPLGWAVSATQRLPGHLTEIRGRVHFDELPLSEFTPVWLRALVQLPDKPSKPLATDVRSTLTIDAQGRPCRIESAFEFESPREVITITGAIEGAEMALAVRSRDLSYQASVPIDPEAVLGDGLSPQTQLPGLREGQAWNVEVCSPLRYPNQPMEVLQAKVERLERLSWNDDMVSAWVVEYRDRSGYQPSSDKRLRGRLWVRLDGMVLKQEMTLFDSTVTLIRMTEEESARLMRDAAR
jgi:hypothetical protein